MSSPEYIACIVCHKLVRNYNNTHYIEIGSKEDYRCTPNPASLTVVDTHYYRIHYGIAGSTDYFEHWFRLAPYRICWLESRRTAEVWCIENEKWETRSKIIEVADVSKEDIPQLIERFNNLKVFL